MILTAAALSTGTIVLIALGSAAGGAVVTAGSYKLYKMMTDKDDPDVQRELRQINEASRQNLRREVQSFTTRNTQIHSQLQDTTSHILSNQEAIHYIEQSLNSSTNEIHQNHDNVRIVIVDLDEANKQLNVLLQGYHAIKNNFNTLAKEHEVILKKYESLVDELNVTVNDYSILRKELMDANGELDYTGNMIELVKRMKVDNAKMSQRMVKLTARYEEKEQEIATKSKRIAQLLEITDNQRVELDQVKAELQGKQPLPTTPAFFRPN